MTIERRFARLHRANKPCLQFMGGRHILWFDARVTWLFGR